jgi:hypothetical protein
LTSYPMNESWRCGAHARTTGKPCRKPRLRGKTRCANHGGKSPGAKPGQAHPNYKSGKYAKQTRELVRQVREMARTGEAMVATAMREAGLPVLEAVRRKRHVVKALRALKAAKAKEGGE